MPIKAPTPEPAAPYVYQNYPKHVKSLIVKDAEGKPRIVTVNSKEEEAHHTGLEPYEVVVEPPKAPEPPKVYVPIQYPKAVKSRHKNGETVVVKDAREEEYHTGVPVEDDEDEPSAVLPPTLEKVMAAGYGKEAAQKIVAEEQRKFAAGEVPYGNKEPLQSGISDDADF
jgi:hypothetical protein